MCHDDASRAPAPPRRGEVGIHGQITVTAGDGNRFAGYRATPATPDGAGMVVLPDVRGLHPFYTDLAQRFAQAGFDSVAIDYFGRTAGVGLREETFDWQQHVQEVDYDHVVADAGAAAKILRDAGAANVYTVGFCFGGGWSWRLSASDLGFAGNIGFYGRPQRVEDVIPEVRSPILMLVAGADRATPQEAFIDMDRKLTEAGKEHEMYVYDGAPHSFFDRAFDEWREACRDAWQRILNFTDRH